MCQETGRARRYLTGDAFSALYQATHRVDQERGSDYHQRFVAYMQDSQERDLSCAVAMTDGKGERSKRPHQQENRDIRSLLQSFLKHKAR